MMKKYLLLFCMAVCAMSVTAQPGQSAQKEVLKLKTADGKVVRYDVVNIREMSFSSLFHAFSGYLTATAAYFQDSYFGGSATLEVWKAAEGYDVTLSDPIWGDAEFENVSMTGGQLSGNGSITVSAQYGGGTYEATVSGAMSSPVITIPSLMNGGTLLTYHMGDVPASLGVKGSHQGSVSVMVGEQFGPYVNEKVTYVITANEDGTVNVTVPAFTLDNTQIGNLTLGSYTIANVAYDADKGVFYRDYTQDNLSFHFKAEGGMTELDNDYTFTQLGNIEVRKTETGITIVNNFQPGRMPFPITSTFVKAQGQTR